MAEHVKAATSHALNASYLLVTRPQPKEVVSIHPKLVNDTVQQSFRKLSVCVYWHCGRSAVRRYQANVGSFGACDATAYRFQELDQLASRHLRKPLSAAGFASLIAFRV